MIKRIWRLLITQLYWRMRFGSIGRRTIMGKPLMISGASSIEIGARCIIREFARLEVIRKKGRPWRPHLSIGDKVNIEQGVHIICQGEIVIEDEVSIAPYCGIFDTAHPNDPPDIGPKIGDRLSDTYDPVRIGKGTLIGMHVVILPNVSIGKGCVIGAGSVVRGDIPDYSVAVGAPARVVSVFDRDTRRWT